MIQFVILIIWYAIFIIRDIIVRFTNMSIEMSLRSNLFMPLYILN